MNDILPFCQCTLPTKTAEADAVATASMAAASKAIAIAAAMRTGSEAIKKSVAVQCGLLSFASNGPVGTPHRAFQHGSDS
jgi:hypothetical protein